MKVYIVIMHRYGEREAHTYIKGIYKNKENAIKVGKEEEMCRDGKYDSVIREEIVNE